jgi:hypothetical protein
VLPERMSHPPQEPSEPVLHLHGPGGGHTEGRVARQTAGQHGRATGRAVLAVIRELAKVCRDLTMAATRTHAAQQWGVSTTLVQRCRAQGTFPARPGVPAAPWILPRTALARPAVHAVVEGGRPGRSHLGLRPYQPEWPGQAGRQAGAEQGVAAPGERPGLTRLSGA